MKLCFSSYCEISPVGLTYDHVQYECGEILNGNDGDEDFRDIGQD